MDINKAKEFFRFILERYSVYEKKEILKLPPPWTQDEVLQKMSFCNVFRKDDKGSKYIIDVCSKIEDPANKFFNIVFYRFFNKYNMYENMLDGEYLDYKTYEFDKYEDILDRKKSEGYGLFSSAYLISQCSASTYRRGEKHVQVLKSIEYLANTLKTTTYFEHFKTMKPSEAINHLCDIKMIGHFLSFQILVDMTYMGLVPYTNNDFCVVGPGAEPTFQYIGGGNLKYKEVVSLCEELRDKQGEIISSLGIKTNMPFIPVLDLQNCGCEFFKYQKFSQGNGKKRYYKGASV